MDEQKGLAKDQSRGGVSVWLMYLLVGLFAVVVICSMGYIFTTGSRMADIIETAWRLGAKFDLWDECFDYDIWRKAFAEYNMNLEECAQRAFAADQILPWDHLASPKKDYLLKHFNEAMDLAQ